MSINQPRIVRRAILSLTLFSTSISIASGLCQKMRRTVPPRTHHSQAKSANAADIGHGSVAYIPMSGNPNLAISAVSLKGKSELRLNGSELVNPPDCGPWGQPSPCGCIWKGNYCS